MEPINRLWESLFIENINIRGSKLIIGQFCETFPPRIDGVGRVMLAYCNTLEQLGHKTYYIAPADEDKTRVEGLGEILYPGIRIPGQPYRIAKPEFSGEYRKTVKDIEFDIVHAHSPFFAANSARRIARKRNIPLVATFHSKYYDDLYEATKSKLIAKIAVKIVVSYFNSCDEVWTVNEETKKVLQGYGYKGEIVVMPNGTNPYILEDKKYEECLKKISIRPGVPVLLFVGQIDLKKNIDSILKALSILDKRGEDFEFFLAGQGQNMKMLRKLSASLGIQEKVHFLGFISDSDFLHTIYKRADLFVFPSVYDNAPMCVREAAGMGTPAVLIEGSCSAEGVEDSVNGFLCQNTPESIAEKIMKALPLAKEVGERAKQTIPIPWIEIIKNAEERYGELCRKHGKKA